MDDTETNVQRPLMAMLGHGAVEKPDSGRKPWGRVMRGRSGGTGGSSAGAISVVTGLLVGTGLFAAYSGLLYADDAGGAGSGLRQAFGYGVYAGLFLVGVGIFFGLKAILLRSQGRLRGAIGIGVNIVVGARILHSLGMVTLPLDRLDGPVMDRLSNMRGLEVLFREGSVDPAVLE